MTFKPGENGSQGLVRAKPIRDALNALLSRSYDEPLTDTPKTYAQYLAMDLMRNAVGGNEKARAEVIDRTEGKAPQAITGGDEGDRPLFPEKVEVVLVKSHAVTDS